ncbi:MAG: ABC transporter permease [Planctomycetaceae bacterium]|nr:ABC transporter permease [Planctomycetaceae bacterium]
MNRHEHSRTAGPPPSADMTSTPIKAPRPSELTRVTTSVPATAAVRRPPDLVYHGARSPWELVDWRELWRYREVLVALATRDLKVRYRQTLVGVAWVVLQPLATMFVFVTLFGLLGRQPAAAGHPYLLVVLAGLAPWQLFTNSLQQASVSLVNNPNLITKVYFPRIILPLAAMVPAMVDFAVSLVILSLATLCCGVWPAVTFCLAPLAILPTLGVTLGLGLWSAALHARYRDVGYALPFLMQITFYLSPVVYESAALIPSSWRWLHACHPLVGAIDLFRWTVLGHAAFPWQTVAVSSVSLLLVLVTGLAYFRQVERDVADRI